MDTRDYAIRYANAVGKALKLAVTVGGPEDGYLLEIDGWVYVAPADIQVEHPRIGAKTAETIEVPGFIVQRVARIPGSFWEPDDYDVVDDGEYRVLTDAIKAAFMLVQENIIENVLQSESESMWADELNSGTVESV